MLMLKLTRSPFSGAARRAIAAAALALVVHLPAIWWWLSPQSPVEPQPVATAMMPSLPAESVEKTRAASATSRTASHRLTRSLETPIVQDWQHRQHRRPRLAAVWAPAIRALASRYTHDGALADLANGQCLIGSRRC